MPGVQTPQTTGKRSTGSQWLRSGTGPGAKFMNVRDALDFGGAILIALGSLPLAAGIARAVLKLLVAAMTSSRERIPT